MMTAADLEEEKSGAALCSAMVRVRMYNQASMRLASL